ncbi:VCBS domain-containing protein [Bradyrhizobium sp. JYMT SZCCT0180]|uniref:VCBS domain-containing protein n=1 Tax=Bradyrhizobium sp. JYMT SZCCT0180 TaxID=2807666 RepID=UPI001BAE2BC0|nr:VCBS domain-containing protein [Bradyrhizobium sp. JYMT SZCCT0180]MBR1212046.1 VCBS domain-containing protein [Bradyrhizobium sp. JYMT SZCCT0180]
MANTPAVIGSPSNNEVTEDASLPFLTAAGFIPISDANPGQAFFKTTVKKATGTLGTLTLAADGTYTYSVANSAVQYLGAGKTKVETFTVTSIDGTTKQISFTIKGTNDAAAIGTPTNSQVTEDTGVSGSNLKSTGTLSISDVDQGEASFKTQVTSVGANLGTLTIAANGSYTYSVSNSATQYLGANDTKTETFTVTALDGTTKQISFTIQGKNDSAVIGTPTVRNTTDTGGSSLTATGMISVSDVDQGQAGFKTTVSSVGTNLGALSLNADGSYTYSVAKSAVGYLSVGVTKTETFTIASVDGTSKQVSFVITGINDAAVIGTPTVSNVTEDATQPILYAFGSISITDADQGEASFKAAMISGQGALGTLVLMPNGSYGYLVAGSAVQYLGAGDTKVDTFTITSKDGTTKQVSFTIHGTNDAAVIGTPTHRDVTADPNQTTLSATGSISISDVDQNQASFKTTVVSAAGNIGNLSLNSNGTYSYTVPESAAEQLGFGGTKIDTFTVTSFDGTTKQVTFVVHGPTSTNQPAVIGNPTVTSVTEDATTPDLTASGTISISDSDGAGQAAFQTTVSSAVGNLGTLSLSSNGSYTYTVANGLTQSLGAGSTKVDTFTVTSLDGTTKQVLFTINGTNDAAVIGTPAVVDVTEDGNLSLSGTLLVTDADQGQGSFQTTVTAVGTALGSLTLGANGAYTYSVPNSATQSLGANVTHVDTFTVKSLDNTTQQVSFTIHGVNDSAVIGTPTVVDVTEDANVVGGNLSLSGTLSIFDADQGEGSFQTSVSPGAGNLGSLTLAANGDYTYSVANSATQSMGAGVTRTDTFTVQSQDGTPKQLSFTIHGSNDAAVIGTPVLVDVTEEVNVVGGNLSLSGVLSVSDDDQGQGSFQAGATGVAGNLGTLTFGADGSYTYSVANSATQSLGPNATHVDTFTITSLDGTPQQVSFNIHGAQDAPTLSVATANGAEDNAIPLSISSALVDSGSALSLTITGVPAGATLNNGTVDAGDSSIWHLSGSDLAGLALNPASDFSGTINLSVTATSTDTATSSQLSTAVQTLTVHVAGVADAPTLTGPLDPIDVDASTAAIPLNLHLALTDSSETLGAVTISGVTGGYVLSAGVYNEDGDYWLVPADQLDGLKMQPGTANTVGASGPFHLHVTARSFDGASVATTSIDVTVNVAPDPDSFSSRVVDGYISGATVFSDDDGDGEFDVGVEASATTAADGTFTITGAGGGKLVMFGGTDVSTGLAFHGTLSAVAGSTVITPLTTLVAALAASSSAADIAIAQTAVLNAFGLGAVDLQTFDPVAAAAEGGSGAAAATKILAAGIQVQTTIAQITAAAGSDTTGADVVSAVASAISGAAGGTVNLTNTVTLTSIIQNAAPDADPAAVNAATQVVSAANTAIASAAAGTGDPLAVLTGLAQAATVALGQGTDQLAAAAAGTGGATFADAIANNTGTNLSTAISNAPVGDPDGSEVGTLGNDTITGAGGNDVIDGLDGNDTLSGLGGKDTIHGSDGNDKLFGGDGDDKLYGDDGKDTLTGGAGDDILNGGNSYDRASYADATGSVTVNLTAHTVSGADGNDTLVSIEGAVGSNFNDTYNATGFAEVNGLPGSSIGQNDFEGKGGNDTIIGTVNALGQKVTRANYLSATGAVTADLALGVADGDASVGHDTLTNISTLWGSAYNDTLRGSDNGFGTYETYEGRAGDDFIDGRGGYDQVTYNNDVATTSGIVIRLAAGTVTGDASVGTDTLRSVEAARGTNFDDLFDASNFGGAGAVNIGSSGTFNDFAGAGGNDQIIGNGATRISYSLAGAAVSVNLDISGAATNALTVAGSANGATEGTDTFTGVNAVQGSVFDDTFLGSNFNNTFTGLGGNDVIDGRGGFDTASYNSLGLGTSGVTVNLAAGTAVATTVGDTSIGSDTLRSIEGIQGTGYADTFIATGYGQAGALNFSNSSANFNQFEGLGGDDNITGNGNTRLGYFNATAGVTVVFTGAGTGTVVGNSSVGTDTFTLVNSITGSAFGDSITGDGTNNIFDGGAGDDTINGGEGSDTITGGAGNDTIDGGSGFADMAVYSAAYPSYAVTVTGAGTGTISGPDGTDTFTDVEVLQFSARYLLTASGTSGSQVNVTGLNFVGGLMVTTATGSNNDFLTIGQQLSNRLIDLGAGTGDTITLGITGGYNLNLAGVENLKGTGGDDFVGMITNVNGLAIDLGTGNNDNVNLAMGANTVSVVNVDNLGVNEVGTSNDTLTLTNLVSGLTINLGLGSNTINLAAGSNSLVNAFGTNTINGTSSADTLTVVNGLFQSTVNLGDGTDTLILTNAFNTLGLSGVENVTGGTGDNFITLQNAVTGVTFNLGAGNDSVNLANGVNSVGVVDVEAISGNDFGGLNPSDDTLTLLNNVSGILINLGDGNNTLNLAAGTNSVLGYGLQTINGTASADVLTTLENAAGSTIDLGAGIDTLNLGVIATGVTVKNVENVNGSTFNDTITIANTSGTTTVTGGMGSDFITASAGQDNIRYTSAAQAGIGGGETVNDFNVANDTFVLDHVAGLAGQIHFVSNGVFTGSPGDFHSEARLNGNILQIDVDGDGQIGAGDMEITLNGLNGTLTDANFVTSGVNHTPTDISLVGSSIAENTTAGTVVGTLSGTDPDAGDILTFSVVNPNGMFAINGNDLVVAGPIDYEAGASQQVTVRVTDASGATYDKLFNIGVTDANDAPTVISGATGSVAENAATSTVVYQAVASDQDAAGPNSTIAWSLAGTDAAAFDIDATGQVTLRNSADYELKNSYSINVVATDGGTLSSTRAVTISVTNVNEAPTNIGLSGDTIAEGSANGTVVGTLSDVDPDAGDSATYTLTGNAGGRFAVSNGQIVVAGALDFETATSHQITVRVTDGGGNTFDKNFTIGVADVTGVTLSGGSDDNTLIGTSEADTLNGLGGNDLLKGLAGNDSLDGGLGFDRADYSDATGGITVNLAAGTVTGPDVGSDTLTGIEAVTGSDFADTFNGAGFTGSVGVPSTVVGQDDFEGRGGDDTIIGTVNALGQMTTRATYIDATSGVTVDLAAGTADGNVSVGHDTLTNVNSIIGSNHNDTFYGSDNPLFTYETFEGRAGDDYIDGRGGFDQVNYNNNPVTTSGIVIQLANGVVTGDASVGTDTLRNVEAARGTIFDDIFDATGFGSVGANVGYNGGFNDFGGAAGNDTIIGNGSTRLNYQSAASSVSVDLETSTPGTTNGVTVAGVATSATEGTDSFTGVNAVQGSMFGDTLLGSSFGNTLTGLGGNDFIDGRGGFDTAGYNSLSTVTSGVTVDMGAGTASGDASIGTDTLRNIEAVQGTMLADNYDASGYGAMGALNFSSSNGTFNQFEGLGGNDVITGNNNTRLVYTNATSGVTVDFAAGTATGDASVGTDTFTGVNSVNGSAFGDTLLGSANGDVFLGLAGNDLNNGRGGFDTALYAGFNTTGGVSVDMAFGVVTGNASVGTDTLRSIESVQGTNFNDTYVATGYGQAGALNVSDSNGNFNQFQGLAGNDTITGNGNTQISYANASAAVNVNLTTGIATGDGSVGTDTITGGVFNVFGSNFNDTIVGTASSDNLSGQNGNDTISGGAGNDVLSGGAGADKFVFATGTGADTVTDFVLGLGKQIDLTGMNGIYSIADVQAHAAQVGGNTVLTFGSDSITLQNVTAANLVASDFIFGAIVGDANANTLTGSSGDDLIQGLGGNDRLQGLDGNDTLDGGSGLDRAVYSDATAGITANLAAGTVSGAGVGSDTLLNIEGIVGSAFADTLNGAGFSGDTGIAGTPVGFHELEGGGGDDTITSAVGSQGALLTRISYVNAVNSVAVDLMAHTATGGDGNDTLVGSGFATVVGSGHADQLLGSTNANGTVEVFEGRAGNDTIDGRAGFDRADYALDPLAVGGINVQLAAGTVTGDATTVGTDTLISVESVRGSNEADTFNAFNFSGASTNAGSNGTFNEFNGMGGDDNIIGNFATRVTYINATGGVVVDLQHNGITPGSGTAGTGIADGDASTGHDTFSGVNAIQASMFNDTLRGSNSVTINETFFGGAGDDLIDGRGGFDIATYNNIYFSTGAITVNFAAGTVTGDASVGNDTLRAIESVQATNFNDVFVATGFGIVGALNVGNSGTFNQFEGLGGNDTITGNGNTRLAYNNATDGVSINLQAGTTSGNSSVGNDTFTGVNSVNGSNFGDTYVATGFVGIGNTGTFNQFEGLGGDDTITGNGSTRISYSQSSAGISVTLTGGAGTATGTAIGTDTFTGVNSVQGSNSVDTITGGNDNEFFFGGGGGDTINAGDGNDGIAGQGGSDIIDGGAGTDLVTFTGAQNLYNITGTGTIQVANTSGNGDGTDSLTNVEVLNFSDAIVLLSSGTSVSPIDISGQLLSGNGGITGSGGDDFLRVGNNVFGRQINLGLGTDTVIVSNGGATLNLVGVENLNGTSGDEFANLTNNANGLIVDLGAGYDTLNLAGGTNTLNITGVDSIGGSDFGAAPGVNDVLNLLSTVIGVNISLGNGNNTMNLAAGPNSFTNIYDVNLVNGTIGGDTLTITGAIAAANGTTVDLGNGDDTLVLAGNVAAFSAVGIEHINGSASDNQLSLTSVVTGIAIDLGGGNDSVSLANGTNSLTINGVENLSASDFTGNLNPSNDTITLLNTVSGVTVNMGEGTANVLNLSAGDNSFDNLWNVNLLSGSSSNDTLTLQGSPANVIDMGDGNDTVNFNMNVFGVTVANTENIDGSSNFDSITISNTASGNTTITAGTGADEVTASAGHDNFRFASIGDSAAGAADTIHNFDADDDSFTFSGISVSGVGHIEYIDSGAFAGGGQASAYLQNLGAGNDLLHIDTNGDGTSDMDVSLQGYTGTLTNNNFLLS